MHMSCGNVGGAMGEGDSNDDGDGGARDGGGLGGVNGGGDNDNDNCVDGGAAT